MQYKAFVSTVIHYNHFGRQEEGNIYPSLHNPSTPNSPKKGVYLTTKQTALMS